MEEVDPEGRCGPEEPPARPSGAFPKIGRQDWEVRIYGQYAAVSPE